MQKLSQKNKPILNHQFEDISMSKKLSSKQCKRMFYPRFSYKINQKNLKKINNFKLSQNVPFKFQSKIQKTNQLILLQQSQRTWMKKRGKKNMLEFQDDQIKQLKKYFQLLDKDNSGSISLEEIGDPFITLGIFHTIEDVENLIKKLDENKNGQIEFRQFLRILKHPKQQSQAIMNFKTILKKQKNVVSFNSMVSNLRRNKMLEYISTRSNEKKKQIQKFIQTCKSLNKHFRRIQKQ